MKEIFSYLANKPTSNPEANHALLNTLIPLEANFPHHPEREEMNPNPHATNAIQVHQLLKLCLIGLLIIQQRSSLLISRDNTLISADAELLSKNTWNCDQ